MGKTTRASIINSLKQIHEINTELVNAKTFHDLCYQIVVLGRERLGFDRIGLVLWDKESGTFRGTVNIDSQGKVIDHRSFSLPVIDDPRVASMIESGDQVRYWEDAPLRQSGESVGTGWFAIAVLYDGDSTIGWLGTDNLIRKEPFSLEKVELLALYASSIGHLLTRKLAEEAASHSAGRFRQLVEQSPFAIIEYDFDFRLLSWNPTAEKLFGYQEKEVLGKSILDLIVPKDLHTKIRNWIQIIKSTKESQIGTNYNITKRGDQILCEWVSFPVLDPSGEMIGYAGITQDVTLREQAKQQELSLELERQKVEFLQTFMNDITHDFKTPLATIKTSLYLLARYSDESKRLEKMAQIWEQTNSLEIMVQNLLTLSRLDYLSNGERKPVNLNEIIKTIIKALRPMIERKNQRLQMDLQPGISSIHAEYEAIYSALSNLIVNAIHYTPENRQIYIVTRTSQHLLECVIADQGIGIAPEELEHIFERHFRSDRARRVMDNGSGLGLAIVKRVIELHNGEIEVESTVDEGTTFRLKFPLEASTQAS